MCVCYLHSHCAQTHITIAATYLVHYYVLSEVTHFLVDVLFVRYVLYVDFAKNVSSRRYGSFLIKNAPMVLNGIVHVAKRDSHVN